MEIGFKKLDSHCQCLYRSIAPLVCFLVTGTWSLFSDPLHTIKYVQYAWQVDTTSIQETGDNYSSDLKLAVQMCLIL